MTTSKIKIKLGAIEIEYEGSESFLKEELPQLLGAVSELYQKSHATLGVVASTSSSEIKNEVGLLTTTSQKLKTTTGALAARLQVKSSADLIIAAAAKLTFDDGLQVIPAGRLLEEIKSAPSYYKASYGTNFVRSLGVLVKSGKLNEPTKNNYALTSKLVSELESRIAE
ncbi:hypothetical protein [Pseudomonas sp. NFR09]|uniref:hypothetical protein n=1 Tax=Pseudomonas sp. NFR09 TaxID=1566249 RepID=UPI0011144425|nr:hypothetical protein [Pseudomonas sp. NFR09]